MATQYLIKLTPKKVTREVVIRACPECGRDLEKKQEPVRDTEIGMLHLCFNMASTAYKDVETSMLCYDCISALKNLSENDNEIEFTKEDIKHFEKGYEMTAGVNDKGQIKRPFSWIEACNSLLKQILKPKTREEWNEENKPVEDTEKAETSEESN